MNVNDYYKYVNNNARFKNSRLLIVPQKKDRDSLRDYYKNTDKSCILKLSRLMHKNNCVLMPAEMFSLIKEEVYKINQNKHVAYVIGLDGYLSLLDADKTYDAYCSLRDILDISTLNVIFLLFEFDTQSYNTIFCNPRYEGSQTVIYFANEHCATKKQYAIMFVGSSWLIHAHPYEQSIQDFIIKLEDEILNKGEIRVAVEYNGCAFAGLNPDIQQVYSLKSFMHIFYDIKKSF